MNGFSESLEARTYEVLVVRRNLRWEVRVNGVARPLIDWLCTKDRAIEHACDRAREVDARVVVVEGADWVVEEVIPVDRDFGRYVRAA